MKKKNLYLWKIKDNGKGIDRDVLSRLFEKFTTKSQYGGTDLGLFISKNIVEDNGGKIRGKNKDNGIGAVFGFAIPLY